MVPHSAETPSTDDKFDPDSTLAFQRRMERAPEWFCSFLAGNSREKSRLRREMATMKGSVVWLVQQRRQGTWSAEGTCPPAGCDAVCLFGQPLSFYLGDPRLDAAAALHGVVSGQATQTAGTQAFAIALHWAEGHSALKKTAQSACPCGPSLGAMPSCW